MLQGYMLILGFKVRRAALRASRHRVDHDNTTMRCSSTQCRHVYSVRHTNALWYLDGNYNQMEVCHTFGGDGFSRVIEMLR